MKFVLATAVALLLMPAPPARAVSPVALVEDIGGNLAGVEFMDYVVPGKVITLGSRETIVLGYIRSCWREAIRGGTVTIGTEQSDVKGGDVSRIRVPCDGGQQVVFQVDAAAAEGKAPLAGRLMRFQPPA